MAWHSTGTGSATPGPWERLPHHGMGTGCVTPLHRDRGHHAVARGQCATPQHRCDTGTAGTRATTATPSPLLTTTAAESARSCGRRKVQNSGQSKGGSRGGSGGSGSPEGTVGTVASWQCAAVRSSPSTTQPVAEPARSRRRGAGGAGGSRGGPASPRRTPYLKLGRGGVKGSPQGPQDPISPHQELCSCLRGTQECRIPRNPRVLAPPTNGWGAPSTQGALGTSRTPQDCRARAPHTAPTVGVILSSYPGAPQDVPGAAPALTPSRCSGKARVPFNLPVIPPQGSRPVGAPASSL